MEVKLGREVKQGKLEVRKKMKKGKKIFEKKMYVEIIAGAMNTGTVAVEYKNGEDRTLRGYNYR
jgi:hypothetical protein